MATTRRQFLTRASTLVSLSPLVPKFLLAASADAAAAHGDRILVVIQMTGGNDGLNTVVPYADDAYHKARSTLAIKPADVLKVDDHVGLHPRLKGFSSLLEAGQLAIVQGVGYPNPNRSHFASMDIWHTAQPKPEARPTGWIGRYLDEQFGADGADIPALHLGPEKQPLALAARKVHAPSVQSLERFRLEHGGDEGLRAAIAASNGATRNESNDLLSFVQGSTTAALASSRKVEASLGTYQSPVKYPETGLAGKLKTVAQLVGAGLRTRIYYVAIDGFDTHSQQGPAHATLLAELSDAVSAFMQDLTHQGQAERVLLMTFSEFGRRVQENASKGTDHGAAAPLFFAGGKLKPGLVGAHPSLTDLEDGDVKHHTDFRQVYATVLGQWLDCQASKVLGQEYSPLPLLTT